MAGGFGTLLLNAATYLDMAVTGRQASRTPEASVQKAAEAVGVRMPRDDARLEAYGALGGMAAGLGLGVTASLVRSAGVRLPAPLGAVAIGGLAMAATDAPMAAAGVSDPRDWSGADWARDVVPHLAYGAGVRWAMDRVDAAHQGAAEEPHTPSRVGLVARAAALGVATGSRSSLAVAGPVVAASSGTPALVAAALTSGELVADKAPGVPSRLDPGPLAARLLGGAGAGVALARGRADAAVGSGVLAMAAGAAGAWVGAVAGAAWRDVAADHGWTWQAGVVEDAVALGLTVRACR